MTRWQANILILLVALVWGSAFVAQQTGMRDIPALFFTGFRFLLGGLVVVPLMLMEWKKVGRRPSGNEWALIGATGLCLYFGAHLQQLGIGLTTVTNAGFFTAVYVLLVPVIGFVIWRTKPHWSIWPAAAGCLGGTYLLAGGELSSLGEGDYLVLASAVFWAFQVLLVGYVVMKTSMPFTLACGQFLTCAVIGISGGVLLDFDALTIAGLQAGLFELLYAGFLSVGVAFTLQAVAQAYTQPTDAAVIMSSEAVFAAIGGAVFLSEVVSPTGMIGCAVILLSVIAVQLLPMLKRSPLPVG